MDLNRAKIARQNRKLIFSRKRRRSQLCNPQSDLTVSQNIAKFKARLARQNRRIVLARKRRRTMLNIAPDNNQILASMASSSTQNIPSYANERATTCNIGRRNRRNVLRRIPVRQAARPIAPIAEVSYLDHGDPTYMCCHCRAYMWFDERNNKNANKAKPTFSQCCTEGKIRLPLLKKPPATLSRLYENNDSRSKHFLKNIRAFNMMFAFTSMGGRIDSSLNRSRGPYVFRLHGQNHHMIGSLLPQTGNTPKFLQLYIHDTENETSNRIAALSTRDDSSEIDASIVEDIKDMLNKDNSLCRAFRMARDRFEQTPPANVRLKLIGTRSVDGRMYNLPTSSEVAALIIGDVNNCTDRRDIIVEERDGNLKRITELHPAYLGMQYPLLFPYGEDGYRIDIPLTHSASSSRKRSRMSMREFFAFRIHERENEASTILQSMKLFQQFSVDAFTMIDAGRLNYHLNHQDTLRSDTYKNLERAVNDGNTSSISTGKRIVLPSSFTGGSRYMFQNYMDAMCLCKIYGYPDLFITFTCNPKWPEIRRYLRDRGLKSEDRPDILCRIFKLKLNQLIKDLKKPKLFGRVEAVVYTIEFQKRGLPHAHIVLWMHRDDKFPSPTDIDKIISAEIPSEEENPQLFENVKSLMMHGPCGAMNFKSPCMIDNQCSKKFPKKYLPDTTVDDDGYPLYRRRNNGVTVDKNGSLLDNRFVVPYNPHLLNKYKAHINVEWCNQSRAIKYLFKYINKGNDRITATVTANSTGVYDGNVRVVDEIKEYYNCRYVSPCEAIWRIFSFDIHYRTPAVQRLSFHLEDEQSVMFDDDDEIDDVINRAEGNDTMFLSWMKWNKKNNIAKRLSYVEFPGKFVWKSQTKSWKPRKKGFSIGRIHPVPIGCGEAYYLRILLNIVKGPTSYEDIRTINGVMYPTFRDACFALGLLDDDKEYIEGIKEVSLWQSAKYLRELFVLLLMSKSLSKPEDVWNETWELISDDILYNRRRLLHLPNLRLSNDQIKNYSLAEIEKLLNNNGDTLRSHSAMPFPESVVQIDSTNRLVTDEFAYDIPTLTAQHYAAMQSINDEQQAVYTTIMTAINNNTGGVYFLYCHGGTGKTFIWRTLSSALRSKGEIVLNVASSAIASLLLDGGRTAHSRFGIPLNITDHSTCNIKPGTHLAELIILTKLIIWDEAPMVNKHCFEALDKSLRDIMRGVDNRNADKPFGGKVIVFGGDFRQILPVIPKGSRQDIVYATINYSYLWDSCQVLRLTKNMRLEVGNTVSNSDAIKEFAQWILNVGDGCITEDNDGEEVIEISEELLLNDTLNPIESIVQSTYPMILENLYEPRYFEDRAILAPTNEIVESINEYLLSIMIGEEHEYLSSDSISNADKSSNYNEDLYSTEYLNSIHCSGLPNHRLKLKIGVPIMLIRNLNHSEGLCNGTRLQITRLGIHVMEAKVITGHTKGEIVFIPRIVLTSTETKFPFTLKRRQFPVSVCFAMTINKSQGQSLSHVGLYLPKPVFSHGQLYVAISRVTSKEGLKILICDKEGRRSNSTINVVYKEVFQNL